MGRIRNEESMPCVTDGSHGSFSYRNYVLGTVQQLKLEWDLRLRRPRTVGNGNLTQHDYIVKNGTLAPGPSTDEDGFHNGESGTYSVNNDCTGNAQIVLSPGNTRSLELVLADNGRTVQTVVSSSMVNGAPAILQVYSTLQKLGR
jgi:hypothetical protein